MKVVGIKPLMEDIDGFVFLWGGMLGGESWGNYMAGAKAGGMMEGNEGMGTSSNGEIYGII